MTCQSCQKKAARVHLTEIGSKMKKEIHLCEDCARQNEAALPHTVGAKIEPMATAPSEVSLGRPEREPDPTTVCGTCGFTFADFRSSGRLGCAEDYESFRRALMPILEKIHGSTKHRGRLPPQASENTIRQRELLRLSDQLERAVKMEKYEEAARLRDQLSELREDGVADQ